MGGCPLAATVALLAASLAGCVRGGYEQPGADLRARDSMRESPAHDLADARGEGNVLGRCADLTAWSCTPGGFGQTLCSADCTPGTGVTYGIICGPAGDCALFLPPETVSRGCVAPLTAGDACSTCREGVLRCTATR